MPGDDRSRAENQPIAYQSVFPSALETIASETAFGLLAELDGMAPFMAARVGAWLEDQFGTAEIGELFTRVDAFPVLLFPWWLEASVREPDPDFHRDIATSTISGYLHIRLIDNLMDGDAPADVGLLPALGFFHSKFTAPYRSHFAGGHPFWTNFLELWVETADLTMQDHALQDIDRDTFERISARKTGAAKIPIAAVAHSLKRTDLLPDWYCLVDVFGRWHQMLNDVFGWPRDLRHGATTYFLSEAGRERTSGETVETWFGREGFGWAMHELNRWMDELRVLADKLGSPDLHRYLDRRRALLAEQAAKVRRGFGALADLGALVGRQGKASPPRV
jgi:hypothetical protein